MTGPSPSAVSEPCSTFRTKHAQTARAPGRESQHDAGGHDGHATQAGGSEKRSRPNPGSSCWEARPAASMRSTAPTKPCMTSFRVITLRPVDTAECAACSGILSPARARPMGRMRSLEILTGGSPRLIAIVAQFGAGRPLHELMDDLLELIDEHTDYFKSHLDSLPHQERRIYLALADLWKPATTREIADRARL